MYVVSVWCHSKKPCPPLAFSLILPFPTGTHGITIRTVAAGSPGIDLRDSVLPTRGDVAAALAFSLHLFFSKKERPDFFSLRNGITISLWRLHTCTVAHYYSRVYSSIFRAARHTCLASASFKYGREWLTRRCSTLPSLPREPPHPAATTTAPPLRAPRAAVACRARWPRRRPSRPPRRRRRA